MSKATVALVLDTRTRKKDGTFPAKIRIIFNRHKKLYGLEMSFTEEDWAKLETPRPRAEYKEIRLKLDTYKAKAVDICHHLSPFTFEEFELEWFGKRKSQKDLGTLIQERVEELFAEERFQTAKSYETLASSLQKYHAKPICLEEVTPKFLSNYDTWLVKQGRTLGTIGIYMRTLKAICNKAIKDKRMPAKWYPFSDYSPPRGQGRNIALSKQDIQKLVNVELEYRGQEDKARDFFIFSYLCNGINFKDILLLEQHNIRDNQLFYIRAKTIRTTRQDQKYIRVHLHEKARDILKKWQSQEEKMNGFIFDILPPNGTNLQKNQIIRKFVDDVNKNLKIVAEKAGITSNLTTYVARHSFASNLLKSGANKSFIQDSLGHQNLATTEAYLSGFDDSEREKWANLLL